MNRKIIFRSCLIIIMLGMAVYYSALEGAFIWDDDNLVANNVHIRSWRYIPMLFTEDIGAGSGSEYNFYRPIQILTYLADYSLWRLQARGYHLTNVLLHISAALAVFWLINILFDDKVLSLLTSALFVAHPIHTEAVAYISGRADSLAFLFILLSFIFYIKHQRLKNVSAFIAAIVFFILALLSKEVSLMLPALLLLFHFTFRARLSISSFLAIAVVAAAYIVLRFTFLSFLLPDLSPHPTLVLRIPSFFAAMADYVRLLFVPAGLHMEYGNKLFVFSDPKTLIGIFIILLLSVYCAARRNKKGLIFFSVSWFIIALLPLSSIYPLNAYMAEHWLYIPSIGFFLILANGLRYIYGFGRFRPFSVVLITGLLTAYSYLSIRQNGYWKEPITFFKRTLEYTPNSVKMHNNMGNAYNAAGRHEDAVRSYKKTLEIDPDYIDAHYNLGNAYSAMGKRGEAIAEYNRAIEIDPAYSKAYNNLGNIYSAGGDTERAIRLYKKAIKINSEYKDAYYNIGNEYRRLGRNKEAISAYSSAIQIDPFDGAAHNNIAVAYYYNGQFGLSIKHCDRAIELGCPVRPEFLEKLEQYR